MKRQWFVALLMTACVIGACAGAAWAQTSTSTTTKQFEIISVTGNTLVVKGPEGTRELVVPAGFMFTVDGKQLGVSELKAGMSGTATITTTTTQRPVVVTEVRNVKIMQAYGNSVVVRAADGTFKLFTSEDAAKYKLKIIRNGKEIEFQQVKAGDMITATIVSEKPGVPLTEQQVNARLVSAGEPPMSPAPAAAAPAPRPAASPSPAAAAPMSSPAPAPAPKTLPKTASQLPLLGLLGVLSLGLGAALTIRRRIAR
jgi:LPXTG-motif cell wall-anchored protein